MDSGNAHGALKTQEAREPRPPTAPHLVLPVILLRVPQDAVAQAADVPEGCVPLVPQLLQTQHGAVAAVGEGCLQQLEDLGAQREEKQLTHCTCWEALPPKHISTPQLPPLSAGEGTPCLGLPAGKGPQTLHRAACRAQTPDFAASERYGSQAKSVSVFSSAKRER